MSGNACDFTLRRHSRPDVHRVSPADSSDRPAAAKLHHPTSSRPVSRPQHRQRPPRHHRQAHHARAAAGVARRPLRRRRQRHLPLEQILPLPAPQRAQVQLGTRNAHHCIAGIAHRTRTRGRRRSIRCGDGNGNGDGSRRSDVLPRRRRRPTAGPPWPPVVTHACQSLPPLPPARPLTAVQAQPAALHYREPSAAQQSPVPRPSGVGRGRPACDARNRDWVASPKNHRHPHPPAPPPPGPPPLVGAPLPAARLASAHDRPPRTTRAPPLRVCLAVSRRSVGTGWARHAQRRHRRPS